MNIRRHVLRWTPMLMRFVGVNSLVQAAGLITGVLIVRALPKEDYGFYSIVAGVLAAFLLLTDAGIAGAVLAKASNLPRTGPAMNSLFATGMRVQRSVAMAVAVLGVLMTSVLLNQLDAPVSVSVAAGVAILLSALPLANKSILQAFQRLRGGYSRLQAVALTGALLRVLAVVVLASTTTLNLFFLLALNLVATYVEAILMRLGVRKQVDYRAPSNSVDRSYFRAILRRTLPMSVSLIIQSQMLLFLLGFMGSADVLAEVSALSRIAIVLAIFGPLISDVGAPIIARAREVRSAIAVRYLVILASFLLIGTGIVAVLGVFATPVLGLLGTQYSGLEWPLVVIAAGTVGILTSDAMRVLNQARGWTRWSWVYIPCAAVWVSLGLFVFDLKLIDQAAMWMALQACTGFVTQVIVFGVGIRSTPRDKSEISE